MKLWCAHKLNPCSEILAIYCVDIQEEEPIPMDSSEPGDTKHVHTIFGRQLKPGLLPMVPEVAEMVGCDPNAMINTVMAPIAQVKQEPNVSGS